MTRVQVPEDVRMQILTLYERGLNLKAYAVAEPYGALSDWEGTEARILAGRLANHLGGHRTGSAILLNAWHADPTHPQAVVYGIGALGNSRGPLAAWEALQRAGEFSDAVPFIRKDLLEL